MQPYPRPIITAEVTFLRAEEGGRSHPPTFDLQNRYMPHIVIESPDVRHSAKDSSAKGCEEYQGVAFLEGPLNYEAGRAGQFVLELMYYPDLPYTDVQPWATFTVREGGKVVGHGLVIGRIDPNDS